MALGEALYPSLQALEITFRNNLYRSAADAFNNSRWFEMRRFNSKRDHNEHFLVKKAKRRLHDAGKPNTPGRVVAELNFGYWVGLLDGRYEKSFWTKVGKTAFPHAPRRFRDRQKILDLIDPIRRLRNRVFHYEPVWYWSNLMQLHSQTFQMLDWMNPDVRKTISILDRFPDVYCQGYEAHRSRLLDIAQA